MLRVENRTPYAVALFPYQEVSGRDAAVVVIKGTFAVRPGRADAPVADEQEPIRHAAEHGGEPGESSMRFDSDMWPPKPGTDVALVGSAHAPSATTELDVSLRVGRLQKTLRVFGDRAFYTTAGRVGITSPKPFVTMPIAYERAFGGKDDSAANPADHGFEERNHVGVGFVAPRGGKKLDGAPLPNIEDPRQLLQNAGDRPPPAGFGMIPPHWAPRLRYAGTYDERWRRERCPLLPLDFDTRYYQAAHPELISPKHLVGGEQVQATNVARGGATLAFALPRRQLDVQVVLKSAKLAAPAALDTVVIEPDRQRLLLTWRAPIACGRDFLCIDRVTIDEAGA